MCGTQEPMGSGVPGGTHPHFFVPTPGFNNEFVQKFRKKFKIYATFELITDSDVELYGIFLFENR